MHGITIGFIVCAVATALAFIFGRAIEQATAREWSDLMDDCRVALTAASFSTTATATPSWEELLFSADFAEIDLKYRAIMAGSDNHVD